MGYLQSLRGERKEITDFYINRIAWRQKYKGENWITAMENAKEDYAGTGNYGDMKIVYNWIIEDLERLQARLLERLSKEREELNK